MKNKGFTLIELLAVIVILAVIALIAIPTILNVVEKAKKKAAISSAYGYIDSIEKQIMTEEMNNNKTITDGTKFVEDINVSYKGKGPDEGTVIVEKGKVNEARLCIGKYSIDYDGKKASISENNYCSTEYEVVLNVGGTEQRKTIKKVTSTTFNVDTTNMTNMSCNNGAIPSISGNTLTVSNIFGDTTCKINSSIKETIDSLDNSETNIVMLNDETLTDTLTISEGKTVNLDLNGKTIEKITAKNILTNNANLIINDSVGTGEIVNSYTEDCGHGIFNLKYIELNNVNLKVDNTCAALYSGTSSNPTLIAETIVNNSNISNTTSGVAIISYSNYNKSLTLNNSTIIGALGVQNVNSGTVVINDSIINTNANAAVRNSSSGIININGGIFTSSSSNVIQNTSTGIINITQTNKPIYITTLAQTWKPAILNNSTGTINITASQADKCTNNPEDTTSGLCVYAEGDGTTDESLGNAAIANYGNNANGTINVNGGTYYGGSFAFTNHQSGIINIKNVHAISKRVGVRNLRIGQISICNSRISETSLYDLQNNSTGTINYDSSTIFSNGTNTPDNSMIYNPSGTITANYTGTCTK